MKVFGFTLIAIGILMLIFRTVNFTHEKKVVDIGLVEINKKENKTVAWPMYAGGIALISGICLVAMDKKGK